MKGKPITNANELAAYAVKVFTAAGFTAWRQNNGGVWDESRQAHRSVASGIKGVADVIGFRHDGLFLACEVKVGRDRVREDQEKFLLSVAASGGIALVCRHARDLAPWDADPNHIPSYPL